MTEQKKTISEIKKEVSDRLDREVQRIYQDVMGHPKVPNLGGMDFMGLFEKACLIGGFSGESLFEEPDLENAAEQIKFLRYAIALQFHREWVDGKIRIGHIEDIPPQALGKLYPGHYLLDAEPGPATEESFTACTQESPMASVFNQIVPGKVRNNGINDHSCAGKDCYCLAGERYTHDIDLENISLVPPPKGFTSLPSDGVIKGIIGDYLAKHAAIAEGLEGVVRQGGVESEITPNGGLIVTITMPDYSGLIVPPVNHGVIRDHVDFQKVYDALGLIYDIKPTGKCHSWSGDVSHYLDPVNYIRTPSNPETEEKHRELHLKISKQAHEEVMKDIDFLDFKGRAFMGLGEAVDYLAVRVDLSNALDVYASEAMAAEVRWAKYAKFRADLNSFIQGPIGYVELMVKNPRFIHLELTTRRELGLETLVCEPGVAVSVKLGFHEDGTPKRASELGAEDFNLLNVARHSHRYKDVLLSSANLDLKRPEINHEIQCGTPGWVASDREMNNMLGGITIVDLTPDHQALHEIAREVVASADMTKPSPAGLLVDPVGNQDPRNGKTIIGVLKV